MKRPRTDGTGRGLAASGGDDVTLSATGICPASTWGMHPSRASNDGTVQCPLCLTTVQAGTMLVAGRAVRLIGEHPACP